MNPRESEAAIPIAVAILIRDDRVLLTRRKAGAHLEGKWEFPGGKVEAGETPSETARREVLEEVGLTVEGLALFHREEFTYPDRVLDLFFFLVTGAQGEPRGREEQEIRWLPVAELEGVDLPAANRRVVELLMEQ